MSTVRTARKKKITIENDQFFVLPKIAKRIEKFVRSQSFFPHIKHIIEPFAGKGGFLDVFPEAEGYDIDLKDPRVQYQDFFERERYGYDPRVTLIVSGPPFGPRSSWVVRCFNDGVLDADYIGYIVPRSWRGKEYWWRRLDPSLRLYAEMDLPDQSFYLPAEGSGMEPYPVPCVFQIWYHYRRGRPTKTSYKITRDTPKSTDDFEFTKNVTQANFAMRHLGWSAGEFIEKKEFGIVRCPGSVLYVKVKNNMVGVLKFFKDDSWKDIKNDATGQRNISKYDVIKAYARR